MMRCLACTCEFDAEGDTICPRCGFDNNQAYIGSHTVWEQAHQKQAAEYRKNFLRRYQTGLTVYHWKDRDGELVQDYVESVPFSPAFTADELLDGHTQWHSEPFGRLPGEQVTFTLCVFRDGEKYREIPVTLKNPPEQELQTVGVYMDMGGHMDGAPDDEKNLPLTEKDDLRLRVVLGNASRREHPEQSEQVDFLGEG